MPEYSENQNTQYDVIVVGGGIAGLTCAQSLVKNDIKVLVLEREDVLGGRIRTYRDGDVSIETGASFMAGFYDNARSLIRASGISATPNKDSQETWLCRPEFPTGPIWPLSALKSSQSISKFAKIRAFPGLLWILANAKMIARSDLDENLIKFDHTSVSTWGKKAFGLEVYENLLEPLVRSLFFWECSRTTRAMIPPIIRGVIEDRNFYRIPDGMSILPEKIGSNVAYKTGVVVKSIQSVGVDCVVQTTRNLFQCKAIVLACPATEAVRLLEQGGHRPGSALKSVSYSSIGVGIVKTSTPVRFDLTRRTVVISSEFDTPLVAFKSVLKGRDLYIRFYWRESKILNSNEFCRQVAKEFVKVGLNDISSAILKGRLVDWVNWQNAIPEFGIGSIERVATGSLHEALPSNITIAGDYTTAPHLEGAVTSGILAASKVLRSVD